MCMDDEVCVSAFSLREPSCFSQNRYSNNSTLTPWKSK